MKKQKIKLLVLNKRAISKFAIKGGLPVTQTCLEACNVLNLNPGHITVPTESVYENTSDYLYHSQINDECAQIMSLQAFCVSVIEHHTCQHTC